tara:strand:- start:281 stop:466 length:186 start_codon:yes stop_codon:yes gene_type:complete
MENVNIVLSILLGIAIGHLITVVIPNKIKCDKPIEPILEIKVVDGVADTTYIYAEKNCYED